MIVWCLIVPVMILLLAAPRAHAATYGERLGWGAGERVVIFHCDDAGMSHSSNLGAVESIEHGVVTSVSVMMPCPWVGEFVEYCKERPDIDAGVHFTLTAEWEHYRWGPLTGKPAAPGLVDAEGCLWKTAEEAVQHASVDEVERELRAQLERAQRMGMPITHLDSHMATLFIQPEFLDRYVLLGIETGIPVFALSGHLKLATRRNPTAVGLLRDTAERVWAAGLPVLDDAHADSYDWPPEEKPSKFRELLRALEPGITEIVVHCARPSDAFAALSPSGPSRLADLESLTDPALSDFIEDEGIILTTWRELKARRDAVGRQG